MDSATDTSKAPAPPAISVLVPTYNYARYLPEAIESVLAQDFGDYELLVIDDRSSDDTAAVMKAFCARDPRIRFTVNPANLGMVANWNRCLAGARGAYVKFLFGDDKLCSIHALGRMRAMLERHPSALLASSARMIVDERSLQVDIWASLPDGFRSGRDILHRCLLENQNLVGEPSAVMFRREAARRGFDAAYRQIVDLEMWFHLLEKGDFVYTREPLCGFRRHKAQQTVVNEAGLVGESEHHLFLARYGMNPEMPLRVRYSIFRQLRRLWRKKPGLVPELRERQRLLLAEVGPARRLFHWTIYTAARHWRKTRRSVKKRWYRLVLKKEPGQFI